jgi:hypothetical protein
MFGWIALTLILWLVASMRTLSGPYPVGRGAAASALDAAGPGPASANPTFAAKMRKLRRRCLPTPAPPPLVCRGPPIDPWTQDSHWLSH